MASSDSKTRFSSRVEFYVRARPGYPRDLVELARRELNLPDGGAIADIGSGTGRLAEIFLEAGYRVIGVEPNADMRRAGEKNLARFPQFVSVDASAESTGLPQTCADLVVAGQAFHWFDAALSRREFARILKPNSFAALVWNERVLSDAFGSEYRDFIEAFAIDRSVIRQRTVEGTSDATMDQFFGPGNWKHVNFANPHRYDWEMLRDRVVSSSYMPLPGAARFDEMLVALHQLFDRHAKDGAKDRTVPFDYRTSVFYGCPSDE